MYSHDGTPTRAQWIWLGIVTLGFLHLVVFPTDVRRPNLQPKLAGCFTGPEDAVPNTLRVDEAGHMLFGNIPVQITIEEYKGGYFLESVPSIMFSDTPNGPLASLNEMNPSIDVEEDFHELRFVKADGGRVIYSKVPCTGRG